MPLSQLKKDFRVALAPSASGTRTLTSCHRSISFTCARRNITGISTQSDQRTDFIDHLKAVGAAIVVTNHNLLPHSRRTPEALASYRLWASAADAVVHHSNWGEQVARDHYSYRPGTSHATVYPGHTAEFVNPQQQIRSHIERDLGLTPCSVRFGIFGKPRALRQAQMVLDTFALAAPRNAGSHSRSTWYGAFATQGLTPGATAGTHVPLEEFPTGIRSRSLYVPADSNTDRLTSGIAMDSLGAGKGVLAGSWQYLVEYLSDSVSFYEEGQEGLAAGLGDLDESNAAGLATAARRLQAERSWELAGARTRDLMLATQ